MAHDDAQIGMIPLYLKQFPECRSTGIPDWPNIQEYRLENRLQDDRQAGSAGETFVRGVRRRQVFSDFRFYTRFHSHTVGYGCSGVGKRGIPKKRQKKSVMIFTDCMTRNTIVLLRGIAKRLAILEVVSYIKI